MMVAVETSDNTDYSQEGRTLTEILSEDLEMDRDAAVDIRELCHTAEARSVIKDGDTLLFAPDWRYEEAWVGDVFPFLSWGEFVERFKHDRRFFDF